MRPGSYLLICLPLRRNLRGAVGASALNTFGRNEIEVAPISFALLRIACLVILYKTCGTTILLVEIHVKPDDTPGAMLQARDAVERRSWSHPREPTGEAWRADVLCGPSRSQAKPAHRLSRQASILWTRR